MLNSNRVLNFFVDSSSIFVVNRNGTHFNSSATISIKALLLGFPVQHALLFVTLSMLGTAIKSHPSNFDNLLEIESASLEFQSLLSISLYNPHKLSRALNWALSLSLSLKAWLSTSLLQWF